MVERDSDGFGDSFVYWLNFFFHWPKEVHGYVIVASLSLIGWKKQGWWMETSWTIWLVMKLLIAPEIGLEDWKIFLTNMDG